MWSNFLWSQSWAFEAILWFFLNWTIIKFDRNPACSSWVNSRFDSELNLIRLHTNPAWSSSGHSSIYLWLKDDGTSYESSLDLLRPLSNWFLINNYQIAHGSSLELFRPFCNWFFIEKWSNFIWIQPGALEAFIYLFLN